jgi:hypothetical protein
LLERFVVIVTSSCVPKEPHQKPQSLSWSPDMEATRTGTRRMDEAAVNLQNNDSEVVSRTFVFGLTPL